MRDEYARAASVGHSGHLSRWSRRAFIGVLGILFLAVNAFFILTRVRWRRHLPAVAVLVDGPFVEGADIQIRADPNPLVLPKTVELWRRDRGAAFVEVKFHFEGEEESLRRIKLTVDLLDSNGKIVGSNSTICEDSRITSRMHMAAGNGTKRLSSTNSETIRVPVQREHLANIVRLRLTFADA